MIKQISRRNSLPACLARATAKRAGPHVLLKGQVMILAVLAIGGTILGATAIAGFLTVSQIRQSGDFANSAKAVFAADAGIEFGLYRLFKDPSYRTPASPTFSLQLSNGARFTAITTPSSIQSTGESIKARRAFLISL